MITLPARTAASVPLPAVGYQRVFLDSADQILKTKDSGGVIRPFGVGTATDLATFSGGPVAVDGGGEPLAAGYFLRSTGLNTAEWELVLLTPVLQTAIQTGALAGDVGDLVRVDITGGNATDTLPTAVGRTDQQIAYKIIGLASGNTVTITPLPAEQIDGGGVGVPVVMNTNNEYLALRSDGTDWMVVT